MSPTRLQFAPLAVCLAFGLAACGDDSTSSSTAGPVDTAPADTAAADTTAPANDGGGYYFPPADPPATDAPDTSVADTVAPPVDAFTVILVETDDFGDVLADGQGRILYLFANDPPDTPTCTTGCVGTWPPLLVSGTPTYGEGLDATLFTIVRGSGGDQLSYNGHPLYYYAADENPGDTNGQAAGGVWFLVDAEGNAIT